MFTGKREAEDEIAKLVSAKKQKKDVAVAQAVEKKKTDTKILKKKKKKQESSSSEDSSEDDKVIHAPNSFCIALNNWLHVSYSYFVVQPTKEKVAPAKNGKSASSSDDSDSSDEDQVNYHLCIFILFFGLFLTNCWCIGSC